MNKVNHRVVFDSPEKIIYQIFIEKKSSYEKSPKALQAAATSYFRHRIPKPIAKSTNKIVVSAAEFNLEKYCYIFGFELIKT